MEHKLIIPCDPGGISDGYHTFDDLYEHRHALFLSLLRSHPDCGFISQIHDDGAEIEGWFLAGLLTAHGWVTYHLPMRLWQIALCTGVPVWPFGPTHDGHTSDDVISRLTKRLLDGSAFLPVNQQKRRKL